ncbi:baseplate wedge [Tenacibaculum phage pT24]|uniref:Baseplate wedge n=1 Tax=Tenacibaculum phage pT24 TaxID=1880590 RepID=A0A1B4XX28_9CAUD|nr:baseplate wedge [Tenacibaculum phage pT24]BAV39363.1 baseplate wedge [Tenacibaculum phage pT24]
MPKVNLYFKDKFKFLKDAYTNIDSISASIREYIDKNIPNRFKSIANLFNLTIDVTKDVSTLHLLNQETAENELNIFTAQNEGNIRGIAQMTGHNPVLPISARGAVRMTLLNGDLKEFGRTVILSSDSIFRNVENGLTYILQNEIDTRIDTSKPYQFLQLIEGTRKSQTFVIDGNSNLVGNKLYTINLDDSEYIEHYDLKVYVNNELWSKNDSLKDMIVDEKAYLKRVGFGNQVDIIFGNGTSGKAVETGDVIRVEYLVTNGEAGNTTNDSTTFEIISGLRDIQGNGINAGQYVSIVKESGFDLGSDGEDSELTRAMTGYSSRALTFARPEYMKSYLSRLSILSHIDAWTDEDDLIFNLLALPKITLSSMREYLTLDESKFSLTETQKTSIKGMLDASRRDWVSTEFVFHNPVIKKYAMFVFIDNSIVYDKLDFKYKVEDVISEIMMKKTYGDVDKDTSNDLISRSDFVNALVDLPEINSVNIDIITEENESAKINGFYDKVETEIIGSSKKKITRRIVVSEDTDPNLGLSDIGDIITNKNETPILRGGFEVYQEGGATQLLPSNGVMIFLKENDQWVNL